MSHNISRVSAVIIVFLVFGQTVPAWAQCGPPSPSTDISTPSFPDLHIIYHKNSIGQGAAVGDSIVFSADGITASITVSSDGLMMNTVNVSNGANAYDWGLGVIQLSSYGSSFPHPIDLGALPPEPYRLWTGMMKMVGEAMESEEFWTFLDLGDKEETVREQLSEVRDGYRMPEMRQEIFGLRFSAREWHDTPGIISRGYSLQGPIAISIRTSDPIGTTVPHLVVSTEGKYPEDRWNVDINPAIQTCTITWDKNEPFTEEDAAPHIADIVATLDFFRDQLPAYQEYGLVEQDCELGIFIDRALDWIDAFSREEKP